MRLFHCYLAYLMVVPLNLSAFTAYFNNGEQWEVDDPLGDEALSVKAIRPTQRALINSKDGTIVKISKQDQYEVIIIHKFNEVVGLIWPEPPPLTEAKNYIHQGDLIRGLNLVDTALKAIEPWPKTPGSWWLKASLLKLAALERLQDAKRLEGWISDLTKHDDGKRPLLSTNLKIARLTLLNCQDEPRAALKDAQVLLPKLDNPEDALRVNFSKAKAQLLLKNYPEALTQFLNICALHGARFEQYPQVLLGIAAALRGLENPATTDSKIHPTAVQYLKRIITECPLSHEAATAQSILNQDTTQTKPTPASST